MKHTPGPWYPHRDMYCEIHGKHPYNQIWTKPEGSNREDRKLIARIVGNTLEEYEANACLIAAAPDLLEACKEVQRVALKLISCIRSRNPHYSPDWHELVKSAISKAEGREGNETYTGTVEGIRRKDNR